MLSSEFMHAESIPPAGPGTAAAGAIDCDETTDVDASSIDTTTKSAAATTNGRCPAAAMAGLKVVFLASSGRL
uniref:Uncharacterized protein n=1 Tax=Arundo donax TaxID=35708 RepID=A0A0A9H168_ARUDO